MAKIICKVCQKEFDNDNDFHPHLKTHKLIQAIYYQTYFPRFDCYDNSMIKFKNKEYYFNTNFNSKSNLKRWLKQVSPDISKKYIIDFLKWRKTLKNLIYAPTQAELRTFMLPGIKYINNNLNGYKNICQSLGFKMRFSNDNLNKNLFSDISNKVIFTDSREQNPLEFDNQTRTKGMSFGDYRMAGSDIRIERKSVADLWGTLTGGIDRFEKEIIRAKESNNYLIILIEGTYNELEKFPEQRKVKGKIKASIEFLNHNLRELYYKYDMIQFLFVDNREEASRIVQTVFSAGNQVKDMDLQYLYDLKEL